MAFINKSNQFPVYLWLRQADKKPAVDTGKDAPIHIGSVDGDTFSKMRFAAVSKNKANSEVS